MSEINPFRILSNLENQKSDVKKLNITGAIIATLTFILVLQPLGLAYAIINEVSSSKLTQSLLILLILAFVSFLVIAVFNGYYIINVKDDMLMVNPINKFTLFNIVLLLLSVLGYLLFFDSLLMPVDKMLQGFNSVEQITKSMAASPMILIGYAFIIGPVLTELVFRSIILGGLLKKYSYKKAILVSALVSGISAFNIAAFMCSFLLSILLGFLYVKTHSLYLCIIGDILYNVVTMILIQYYPQYLLLMSSNIIIIVSLTVTGLLLMYFGLKNLSSKV
jgi:uncharacterized protein